MSSKIPWRSTSAADHESQTPGWIRVSERLDSLERKQQRASWEQNSPILEVPPIPFTHSKNHRNIYRRKACRSRPSHVAKRFTSHDNCFLRPRISITIVSSAWMAALTLSSLLASKAPESMSVMCYVFSQLFAQLQQWRVWYDYPSLTTITVPINEDESFTRESEESTQRKYLRSTQ